MVGQLNGGWTIAKRLLQYERQNISGGFGGGGGAAGWPAAARRDARKRYVGLDETGALADADLRSRITDHLMDAQAFGLTGRRRRRRRSRATAARAPPPRSSSTRPDVRPGTLRAGAGDHGRPGPGLGGRGLLARRDRDRRARWLGGKAHLIEGGSSEVRINIIAKRILGLPDPPQANAGAVGRRASMADFGGDELEALPRRGARLAGGELPAVAAARREAPADPEAVRAAHGATTELVAAGAWPRRAGARRPGPPSTAAAASRRPRRGCCARRWSAIGAHNPIGGMGVEHVRPDPARIRHRGRRSSATSRRSSSGELRWCQGYSEPGAGSDLASLADQREDAGDHWLVNGQKIWTSGAQYADWCFCLVRTDPAKKHEGISFVLIDMQPAGRRDRARSS